MCPSSPAVISLLTQTDVVKSEEIIRLIKVAMRFVCVCVGVTELTEINLGDLKKDLLYKFTQMVTISGEKCQLRLKKRLKELETRRDKIWL